MASNKAVDFTPRDLNQAWHEINGSGGRATFDSVRARARELRAQAVAAEQTGALFMQDGGSVKRELERQQTPGAAVAVSPVPTEPPPAAAAVPRAAPAAAPMRPQAVTPPAAAPVSAVAPAEEGKRERKFKPWQKIKSSWENYITKTAHGASVIGARLRNDYQRLINQQLEGQLIDAEEAKQRERLLDSIGEKLVSEPVQVRSTLGEGGALTRDWEEYRKEIRQAIKDAGGDSKAVLQADRMVTEYQMSKFNEFGLRAHASLAAGDAQAAQRLMTQAFQYMPTGTSMRFETLMSPQGQQLVAVFTNEEDGKPVDAKVVTDKDLLGWIERFADPKAWLTFTTDLTSKERGDLLASMDREISAANAAANQMSAEAQMLNAQTGAARAAADPNAQQPKGVMTPEDFSDMIAAENKARQEMSLIGGDVLPPIPLEDALAMRGLVERIHAYQPSLSVGDIGQLVVKGWGDPQMMEKLIANGLLPAGGYSTGGGF